MPSAANRIFDDMGAIIQLPKSLHLAFNQSVIGIPSNVVLFVSKFSKNKRGEKMRRILEVSIIVLVIASTLITPPLLRALFARQSSQKKTVEVGE